MFIFLSKKIAIPNNTRLRALAWNPDHGWLACGGDDSLLKVLKLDVTPTKESGGVRGIAAPTNLSMNQTLEGHRGAVLVTTWNPTYRKLTTSDAGGLITVWVLHKGVWFEEMINNRGKSFVKDMKWRSNGMEICIGYEDGHVILGTVDGSRVWSREIGSRMAFLEWSPDGNWLLFGTDTGAVHVYNHAGSRVGAVELTAVADIGSGVPLTAMEWYDGAEGYAFPGMPCLAIAFSNGRVQIMREPHDPHPILVDTGLRLTQCKWNTSGTVLALGGIRGGGSGAGAGAAGKDVAEVQYYTPFGRYITNMKVPGGAITSLTWEGGGLRMALAVDSFVFFANVRPQYKWGSFGDCVVYSFTRPDRAEQCVVFWNIKTDERYIKYVKRLLAVAAAGDNCVLVTAADPDEEADPLLTPAVAGPCGTPFAAQYILILCNAIGSPVDSKYISVRPDFVAMTPYHIVVSSTDTLYIWQYRTAVSKLTSAESGVPSLRRKDGRERIFHIDDSALGADGGSAGGDPGAAAGAGAGAGTAASASRPVADPICSIAASTKCLLVGRESGVVQQYSLPTVSLENRHTLRCRPVTMQLNCESTRFSIIDINSVLTIFDMEARTVNAAGATVQGEHLAFERKDIWQVVWAEDNAELWAAMEKTRMYVFRETDPEEPTLSSGYLARFNDLTVTSILLDDVMAQPDKPERASMVIDHETRSLRDSRSLLVKNGLRDVTSFIEKNRHPRLWRLLAETALDKLDLITAEKAFVACSDYPGIQFVKRLRVLHDRSKQRAEVLVYFKRFEDAEKVYMDMDRKDLAVDLRVRLGDWERVLAIMTLPSSSGAGGAVGDDAMLKLAQQRMGDFYADRQKWRRAIPFYEQAKTYDALVEAYYVVEEYRKLEELVELLPEGSPLLANVAFKLQSVGLTKGASQAFMRAGDVKAAVDCCVQLNEWDRAVELAEKHKLPQIEGLLAKYAAMLLDGNKTIAAIELYRKANRDAESAKLLAKLAADVARTRANPLRAKKLYVLAALEVERHRRRTMDLASMAGGGGGAGAAAATLSSTGAGGRSAAAAATAATLNTLLRADAESSSLSGADAAAARTLDAAWHGAEAFHFFMLAQRQLYSGDAMSAMTTATRLSLYEDMVDPRDIYAVIALTAYYARCLGTCSRAFIKLEALESIPYAEREAYGEVALAIFTAARPLDPADSADNSVRCPTASCRATLKAWALNCMACGANFPACVASGRPIFAGDTYRCRVCRHRALRTALGPAKTCPLCHAPVVSEEAAAAAAAAAAMPALAAAATAPAGAVAAPAGTTAATRAGGARLSSTTGTPAAAAAGGGGGTGRLAAALSAAGGKRA